jgi:hypothetical protein
VQIRRPAQAAVTRLVIGTVTLGLFVAGVSAQTPATPASPAASAPTGPTLQAELLKTIDASHAKAGDEVTARIVAPVEFDGAKYPAGAVVLGHVTEVDPTAWARGEIWSPVDRGGECGIITARSDSPT